MKGKTPALHGTMKCTWSYLEHNKGLLNLQPRYKTYIVYINYKQKVNVSCFVRLGTIVNLLCKFY